MPSLTGKTEYGKIVVAKLRQKLVSRSLANSNYQGDARVAAAVMIPTTPEFSVGDYSKTSIGSNSVSYDTNGWINAPIDKDKFVNIYIDNYDLATLPYDEKANALDRAGYALAKADDSDAIDTLKRVLLVMVVMVMLTALVTLDINRLVQLQQLALAKIFTMQ